MTEKKTKSRFSLSTTILIGFALGVMCGIFFGEYCRYLNAVGAIFIKLLQMTILPYIVVSLIVAIGTLSFSEAKLLATKGGVWILLFTGIGLIVIFAMPLAFPAIKSASFFSISMTQMQPGPDYFDLFIPSNPFRSMAENLIPAVVLFSIVVGLALMGIKDKQNLLLPLSTLQAALSRVAHFIVKLAPLGVFAISASIAGTITLEELGRLHVYFIVFTVAAIILTFWLIPLLVTSLTPFKYKDIFGISKDALVTGFATGSLFLILPILVKNCKDLIQKYRLEHKESSSFVDTVIPAFYTFPHLGKMLLLLFVLFAAWFYDSPLSLTEYPGLVFLGLPSLFGKAHTALPFLLNSMKLPSDIYQLYEVTVMINGRFQTLVAGMSLLAITLLITGSITGFLSVNWKKLLTFIILTVVIMAGAILGTRAFLGITLQTEYTKDKVIEGMYLLNNPVPAVVHKTVPERSTVPESGQSLLEEIQNRGILRVGYKEDRLPFSFFNRRGDLVGFDIDIAHRLARELGVSLEFIPVEYETMAQLLRENRIDIIMSGIPITTPLLAQMTFSDAYMDLTIGIVVKDHDRKDFATPERIKAIENLRVGIPIKFKYIASEAEDFFPNIEVIEIKSVPDFFEVGNDEVDILVMTAEIASAWTLLYPEYQVVVPQPVVGTIPVGYPVAADDIKMLNFINRWIDIKKKDKNIEEAYNYWILGRGAVEKQPRWSIIRNLLHWVD